MVSIYKLYITYILFNGIVKQTIRLFSSEKVNFWMRKRDFGEQSREFSKFGDRYCWNKAFICVGFLFFSSFFTAIEAVASGADKNLHKTK
jgi:hypothetical protein